jgi:hypothetical protein
MELNKAVEILRWYTKYRRGTKHQMRYKSQEISLAIDIVIRNVTK